MPKIKIESDEKYPYYDVGFNDDDWGVEVEVTHDELEWIKTRLGQRDELDTFLSDKEEEAEARLAEARKLEEERKAAAQAARPTHMKTVGRMLCGTKEDHPNWTWDLPCVTCKDCLAAVEAKNP